MGGGIGDEPHHKDYVIFFPFTCIFINCIVLICKQLTATVIILFPLSSYFPVRSFQKISGDACVLFITE